MVDSTHTGQKKIAIAVTSASPEFWPGGFHTGYFFTEVLHPYITFTNHGYTVDLVSETGKTGIDQNSQLYAQIDSVSRTAYNDKNHEIWSKLGKDLKKASDLSANDYTAIFFAGGHGAAFDFPTATGLQTLASEIYANNGVIGVVCHGPAIFVGLKDKKTGELLAKGKKITGFNKRGEYMMLAAPSLNKHHVEHIEDMVRKAGGDWQEPSNENINPMSPYVVEDQRIVSGPNPMSASIIAQRVCELIAGHKLDDKQPKHSII